MSTPPMTLADLRSARSEGKRPSAPGANLHGAYLYGADLRRANLYRADLHGANLYGANLRRANLYRAYLDGANLYGANLRRANLRRANLYRADLRGADLDGADLYRADLYGANLHGADLDGADLYGASWGGLRIDGMPSGQATLTPTPQGWKLKYGCWVGDVAGLRDIIDGRVLPPEARDEEIERRRPGWIAVAAMCDAHIAARPGIVEELAAKWGVKS